MPTPVLGHSWRGGAVGKIALSEDGKARGKGGLKFH